MYTIRSATQQDCQALGEIYCHSWKTAYRDLLPEEFLASLTPEGSEPRWIDSRTTLVVTDGTKPIGVTKVGPSRWDEFEGYGEIMTLYLLPEYQGKGFGKILLQNAIERLLDLGYRRVHLWVIEDNQSARQFYESKGFSLNGAKQERDFRGTWITEVGYTLDKPFSE